LDQINAEEASLKKNIKNITLQKHLTVIVTNLVASHHTTATHHPWTTTPIILCNEEAV